MIPKTLYHYTNVESLALILKHRTIKFNPLHKMDDTQEQQSSDFQNLGKICFVSSWTDIEDESIPMWRLYSPKDSGVRISLPLHPFETYNDYTYALTHGVPKLCPSTPTPKTTIVSFQEMFEKDFILIDIHGDFMVTKIQYSDSHDKLYPKLFENHTNNYSVRINDLGLYKSTFWEFQSEWRYRLFPVPIKPALLNTPGLFKNELISKFLNNNLELPFESLFLKIKSDAFEKMEIILSPNITPGYESIVRDLVNLYNPKATIIPSTLTEKIV